MEPGTLSWPTAWAQTSPCHWVAEQATQMWIHAGRLPPTLTQVASLTLGFFMAFGDHQSHICHSRPWSLQGYWWQPGLGWHHGSEWQHRLSISVWPLLLHGLHDSTQAAGTAQILCMSPGGNLCNRAQCTPWQQLGLGSRHGLKHQLSLDGILVLSGSSGHSDQNGFDGTMAPVL